MRNPNVEQFVQSVVMLKDSYITAAYTDRSLANSETFCINGRCVFRCDTTFELIKDLWLTDNRYTNFSLINADTGKHPEFPGPMMLHFQEDEITYRRFGLELLNGNPRLADIKKVGHDMDPALKKGLTSVFRSAEDHICLQHVSERDRIKLESLHASPTDKKRVLRDIYGSQVKGIMDFGLADTIDKEDFNVKLSSLKPIWDVKASGFHDWFVKNRSEIFKIQVIGEALDRLDLCERFTTNRLEIFHKIQKKHGREAKTKGEVSAVLNMLESWLLSFDRENERAFYGQGKYRLSPGHESVFRDPTLYMNWTDERKRKQLEQFINFTPSFAATYKKPNDAGRKRKMQPNKPRRCDNEVELFNDRLDIDFRAQPNGKTAINAIAREDDDQQPPSQQILLDSQANEENNEVQQRPPTSTITSPVNTTDDDLLFLDPFRSESAAYHLVHRNDNKNCHKKVKRCEYCRIVFTSADVVLVRTKGRRPYTCPKSGKEKCTYANVYLHFLQGCLKGYNGKFSFTGVVVLKETINRLPVTSIEKFRKMNMQIEQ